MRDLQMANKQRKRWSASLVMTNVQIKTIWKRQTIPSITKDTEKITKIHYHKAVVKNPPANAGDTGDLGPISG